MSGESAIEPKPTGGEKTRFLPLTFDRLEGWRNEDHKAALSAFRVSARRMAERPYTTKQLGVDAAALASIGKMALGLPKDLPGEAARTFFEQNFQPSRLSTAGENGFVTGYFEPALAASPVKTARFRYPILSRPDDLVTVDNNNRPKGFPDDFQFARRTEKGLVEYYDRGEIERGALAGRGLELFWLESRVDVFFIHIQGSARLTLPDGTIRRISYAGKTGHPFTPIGRLLIERGELARADVTMRSIRDGLEARPGEADALMRENRSYIFFQEVSHPSPELGPVAAAGVPLTPLRSLAIDHRLHTFGTPIWVSTETPLPDSVKPFRRLMIAQDTGSAIIGPARGDLFIGTGSEAGEIAGAIKHIADFVVFLPAERPFQQ